MLTVTAYETDRRGNAITDTAKDYTALTDAVKDKKSDPDLIFFVGCDTEDKAAVDTYLASVNMQLYPSRRAPGRFVMGFQKGGGRPVVPCTIPEVQV